jgi:P2 family phage contractile tail tube protein
MTRYILKNFNFFAEAESFIGVALELTPPKIVVASEEFRAAGMDAPITIDMGLEHMTAEVKFGSYVKQMEAMVGSLTPFQFTARGAFQADDGTVKAVVIKMTAKVHEGDQGTWKAGEKSENAFTLHLQYYQHSVDKEVLHEFDILNGKRVVNGVDQTEAIRRALGVSA